MKISRKGMLAVGLLAATSMVAIAAGNYSTYPIVGGASFCASTNGSSPSVGGTTGQQGANTICAQTIPAGPSLTDEELIPADTQATGINGPTQTVTIPSGLLGGLNLKVNRLIGGDFGTNLWQRAASSFAAASPTAAIMTADRWWVISASNVVTVTKSTPASSAADYLGASGFYSWMRVARPSGTPSGATCVGQTLDQEAAAALINHNAVLSFYGYAPSTFSATNSAITVTIAYFTAADAAATQATIGYAGGNSSTFALSASGQAGGITGYVAATAGTGTNTTGTLASGVETIALSTTPTNYTVWAPIPSSNAAGTAVTGVGIAICATPTATTTVSTDYFEIAGVQLQAMTGGATTTLPNGITTATAYERRAPVVEALNELYYSFVVTEGATAKVRAQCTASSTTVAQCLVNFPVAMRIVPVLKYTAGFATATTTALSTLGNCSGLATSSLSTTVVANTGVLAACTATTVPAAGSGDFLWDNNGSGVISASAEP